MNYKGYEIIAERNSWTEFEVLDEGDLGNVIDTQYDDSIRYAWTKDHNRSDFEFDSLDDVKQAIDEIKGANNGI